MRRIGAPAAARPGPGPRRIRPQFSRPTGRAAGRFLAGATRRYAAPRGRTWRCEKPAGRDREKSCRSLGRRWTRWPPCASETGGCPSYMDGLDLQDRMLPGAHYEALRRAPRAAGIRTLSSAGCAGGHRAVSVDDAGLAGAQAGAGKAQAVRQAPLHRRARRGSRNPPGRKKWAGRCRPGRRQGTGWRARCGAAEDDGGRAAGGVHGGAAPWYGSRAARLSMK